MKVKRETNSPQVLARVERAKADRLLTADEVARFLRVSVFTLKWWRTKKHLAGPDFIRVGHLVRYPVRELLTWLSVNSTACTWPRVSMGNDPKFRGDRRSGLLNAGSLNCFHSAALLLSPLPGSPPCGRAISSKVGIANRKKGRQ